MVGSAMKRARACWDVSLEQAASAAGISLEKLRRIEAGEKKPNDILLGFYAFRYRCDLDELRKARDDPNKPKPTHVCNVMVRLGRRKDSPADRGCSFCRRSMLEVRFSVRALEHPQARICDDCLLHCTDVMRRAIYEGTC